MVPLGRSLSRDSLPFRASAGRKVQSFASQTSISSVTALAHSFRGLPPTPHPTSPGHAGHPQTHGATPAQRGAQGGEEGGARGHRREVVPHRAAAAVRPVAAGAGARGAAGARRRLAAGAAGGEARHRRPRRVLRRLRLLDLPPARRAQLAEVWHRGGGPRRGGPEGPSGRGQDRQGDAADRGERGVRGGERQRGASCLRSTKPRWEAAS